MAESSSWKIVLIDDEEDIRDVLTMALEDAGYQVFAAPDGPAGLALCEEVRPQIVLTDIRMPGMDGITVLETLKRTRPEIEVVVATAYGEMDLAIRALQLDASDFINKPIHDEALQLALKRARERCTARKQIADYTALLEKENAETSQQLIRSIAFQRNLIESSMDGILACDAKGSILTFNRSMEHISGFPRNEVIRRRYLEELLPAGEEQNLREALAGERYGGRNRLVLYETRLIGAGDRKIPVQVSASVLQEAGQTVGLVCFLRDLREVRRLERELTDQARILHQDKMMSLGRLAASVVHEINNPLTGVLNYLRLMQRLTAKGSPGAEELEKFRRYLELAANEISRCSNIVSNLLTFSRKSPQAFSALTIRELIDRCVVLSQHKLELSKIELETEIERNVPAVRGDVNQLQQCLINLILNAVDAMPDGGRLRLSVSFDAQRNRVCIRVSDNGGGIASQDLPQIFEPFFTTKQEGYGTGLGLSTVYGIVEQHGGTVEVDSRLGEGSTFTIELPPAENSR
jgi:PAS domain S-box-containing protein